MKEFYMTQSIPLNFPEEIREEAVKDMKTKLPNNASIRYEGYMSMGQDTFAIIYTMGSDDDDYEEETGDYYERQTSWDNRD